MYRPPEKPAEPPSNNRSRLPTMKAVPETNDLRGLFSEAQKYHNKLIEQPFMCANQSVTMVLTVELKIGDATPIWTLYQGDGPGSIMVWHCAERDYELIYDVVSMFVYEVEKQHYQTTQPLVEAEFREPGTTATATATAPVEAQPSYFQDITPVDFDLLKKQSNVLLGYMLVEAGFISEPILESALKLQEMVRSDALTPMQACETLRRTHARESGQTRPKEAPAPESKKVVSKDTQLVVELLTKAGIVTEQDMQAVVAVKRKHGGDVGAMLVSSGKLEQSTFEAAEKCWPWVRDGLMKPEQAIIALGYCQRARVPLEEALDELGYEKPVS